MEEIVKVKEIMSQPVITITEDAPLAQVAQLMLDRGIGGVPVTNIAGELIGIITESDFTAREKCLPFSLFRFPQPVSCKLPGYSITTSAWVSTRRGNTCFAVKYNHSGRGQCAIGALNFGFVATLH